VSEHATERVLPATPRRRQLAREEGRVAKSHDLPAAVVLLAGVAFLLFSGAALAQVFADFARQQFGTSVQLQADAELAVQSGRAILLAFGRVLAPLLGVLLVAALMGNLGQTGWLCVPDRLAPDPSRINPLTGLQRLCSAANMMHVVLAVLKVTAILGLAAWVIWNDRQQLLTLGTRPAAQAIAGLAELALWTCLKIAGVLLLVGLADYAWQWWRFENSLKMTADEMREDLRHQQGDPAVAGRRRRLQREVALTGVHTAAAGADLVIADGTRFAVALRYDPLAMAAPTVVAKGSADLAQRICRAAEEHQIPVRQQAELAATLSRSTGLGRAIDPAHYDDVARLWNGRAGAAGGATR
jgi:flagellar biosynthetic protein FlhB